MSDSTIPVYPITAIALCNSIGANRAEVCQALFDGRAGLGPSPIPLPFDTVVGAVGADLPKLPHELEAWSTRATRIASLLLDDVRPELDRLRARWRPERIAVLLGTSTGGADVTETAYRHYLTRGSLPDDYDLFRQHTFGGILHVVRELAGATGPAWMVSTACTSSAKPLASAARMI
jgi:3-oxoacyl-[acyl-carrier-protein] synthase-1